jgi:hypothetical protein
VRGRLTYDDAGGAALQIAKGSRERFASDDLESGTDEEIRRAWDGYHAWFGRFTLSADGQTVTHHIEASLFPNWNGRGADAARHPRGGRARPPLDALALRRRGGGVPDALGARPR